MEPITDLFGNIGEDFQRHLTIESGNERIVFSGAFGIGKTTFLNWFFNASEDKDEYEVFHLFPVNYSVLSNEDIFKYIKYDIIYELIEKNALEIDSSFSDEKKYLSSNLLDLSALLLLLIPKMGRQLYKLKEKLEELIQKFLEQAEKGNEGQQAVSNLLNSYTKREGDLYEFNIVTQIINDSIAKVKRSKKKTVLIIDDLDRIDPNHIFRLFNVFAAHFDKSRNLHENKFGFDHIVMVCDIQNIKHIYRHIYGIQTNFNGYVDKFYSREIYVFDNYDNISSFLKILFDSIQFIGDSESYTEYLNSSSDLKKDLILLFQNFILNRQISLRNLMRHYGLEIKLNAKRIDFHNESKNPQIYDWQLSVIHFIRVTSHFFVDFEAFKKAVDVCKGSERLRQANTIEFLIGDVVMFLDSTESKIGTNEFSYYDKERDVKIGYKTRTEASNIECARVTTIKGKSRLYLNMNTYFYYLSMALEKLKGVGYLN